MAYDILGRRIKKKRSTDRRAGRRVPHVGKKPRSRTKGGRWAKKRSDVGKKRKKRNIFGL